MSVTNADRTLKDAVLATAAAPLPEPAPSERWSATPILVAAGRWIYVFMAAMFVVITLVAFIPDSLTKIAAVQSCARAPFPVIVHLHAVLMGSFLLLLLVQTTLAAKGQIGWHRRLGMLAMFIVPALVVVGVVLVPTMYREVLAAYQVAPPGARAGLLAALARKENIMLMQLRMGVLFPLLLAIGLAARNRDTGFHKRMMTLATVVVLPPSIDRLEWLPSSFPHDMITTELYLLLVVSPMFLLDIVRHRQIHRAYWVWAGVSLPFVLTLHFLWDTPWWHATVRHFVAV